MIVFAIFLISVFYSYGSTFVTPPQQVDGPLSPATVDGMPVTDAEVARRMQSSMDGWRSQNPTRAVGALATLSFRAEALNAAIDRQVLLSEGRLQGIEVSPDDIERRWECDVERFAPPSKTDGLEDVWSHLQARKVALKGFRAYLRSLGMNETAYRAALAEEILIEAIEVDLSQSARQAAEGAMEILLESVRDRLRSGTPLEEAGRTFAGVPGINYQAPTWITRQSAEQQGLPFDGLWALDGWMEIPLDGETRFLEVFARRAAEGQGFEDFVASQQPNTEEGFSLDEVVVDADSLKPQFEAVRASTLRIFPDVGQRLNEARALLRAQHDVVINDSILLAYEELIAGNLKRAAAAADELLATEPGRTDALVICAWSRLATEVVDPEEEHEDLSPEEDAWSERGTRCAIEASNQTPYDADLQILVARLLLSEGKTEEAITHLEEASLYRGDDFGLSLTLSSLYREADREDLALLEEAALTEMIQRINPQASQ